jgi:hypothetical protein
MLLELAQAVQDQLQTERPEQTERSQYLAPLRPQVGVAAALMEILVLVCLEVLAVAALVLAHHMQAVRVIHRLPRLLKEIMVVLVRQQPVVAVVAELELLGQTDREIMAARVVQGPLLLFQGLL